MKKQRILVTGGAGLLGSHLCSALVRDGHHVICLDNFSMGTMENLESLRDFSSFEVVHQDVSQAFHFPVDRVYNLASPASPEHYQRAPISTVKSNVLGMIHALELCRQWGAPLVQASTSEVYGEPEIHPQHEEYVGHVNPIGPRSCYNEGKRVAETLCWSYCREYGVEARVVRIFNTYGPNMGIGDGRVVGNFILRALKNEAITIHGDGEQTRSFCYVDDTVAGLIKMMERGVNVEDGPINLGNPNEIKVLELARLVVELCGSSSQILHTPSLQDDPRRRRPDITRAERLLDWRPGVGLREGLLKTISYFENSLSRGELEPLVSSVGFDLSGLGA